MMESCDDPYRANDRSWRKNSSNAVSLSLQEEEDEENLKKAAVLGKPHTCDEHHGVFSRFREGDGEADLSNYRPGEKVLINKLPSRSVRNNEQLLLQLSRYFHRVGIVVPTIEVRFEHLNVELPNSKRFWKYIDVFSCQEERRHILHDLNGIIRPGRMTLLLGPPCSGKTTLLMSLAGRCNPNLKVSGAVTYNGHDLNEFAAQRTAVYISENDQHIPEMTVRETIAFSARFQGVGSHYDKLLRAANIQLDPDVDIFLKAWVDEDDKEKLVVDYIIKVLGLEKCAETLVGNQMIRGISGGQRKRVTIGEMLVGPASVLFLDEITTGLDSATAFNIMNAFQKYIHLFSRTGVISLLQPEPEIYNLFDDIILMCEGYIIYQGPRCDVLDFFDGMGFRCPERKATADFLQEVTSRKVQQQYWARSDEPYHFISAEEFAEAFKSFHVGHQILQMLSTPFDRRKNHPDALLTSKFGIGRKELFYACLSREYLIMKRNRNVHLFKLAQLIVMALVLITIYLGTNLHKESLSDGIIYLISFLYTVVRIMVNEFGDIPLIIMKLPVFFKQRNHFFPAWAYALSSCIMKFPMSFIDIGIWVFTTYFAIGYDASGGRLFKQFLLLLIVNYMSSGLFRLIGVVSRNMVIAQPVGSMVVTLFLGLGGFIITREKVRKWWIWGYWASPLMYAANALVVNEFLGPSWSHVPPNSTEPLGVILIELQGLFPRSYWYWLGVGVLLGFTILFNVLYILAMTYVKSIGMHGATVSEHEQEKTITGIKERAQSGTGSRFLDNIEPQDAPRTGLAFEKRHLTFDQVTYSVDMPQKMKNRHNAGNRLELLKGVSGALRPGFLTAIMGASGSGKTTLMDVLAGRKTSGYIGGEVRISGYTKKQNTFIRIFGYCEQNDVHSPYVTVYESLLLSSWLRLSPEVDPETRKVCIEEIMDLVELAQLSKVVVGLEGVDGLSKEQRKKLTIAVELVANPSIMFMDEPSSGLDSRAVSAVMKVVRNVVETGRTIACTIHQPSMEIFEAFDELILLKHGGREIYVGPLGHRCCHLIDYFEGIQGVSKIEDEYNPATWVLEITTPNQELALGVDFAELYRNSGLYRSNKALIEELSKPDHSSGELSFPSQFALPLFKQYIACLWRQNSSYRHNFSYNGVRLLIAISQALIFGTVFWDLGNKVTTIIDFSSAMGSMFIAVVTISMQNAMFVIPVVAIERVVFYRERAMGMYSPLPYALAQATIELPYVFLQALVYAVVAYPMIGYEWSVTKFFWYFFFMFFAFLYMTYFGMMAMALTKYESAAATIVMFIFLLWNMFTGYVIPLPRFPIWWRWYAWACPVYWTMYGLVASLFGDVKDLLEEGVTVERYVRVSFGFQPELLGEVAAANVGFAVLFACIFALAMKVLHFEKR